MRRLRILLQSRYLFKVVFVVVLVGCILFTKFFSFHSKYLGDETVFYGVVMDSQIDGDRLILTLKAKEKLFIYYYFSSEMEKNKYCDYLNLGDIISVTGSLSIPSNSTVFHQFNYRKYLYYRGIYYIVMAQNIKVVRQ